MQKLEFVVVCEGVSDFEVLKILLSEIGRSLGVEITARLLSPAQDETTRRRARGGWGSVQAWCRANGATRQSSLTETDLAPLHNAGFPIQFIKPAQPKPRWPTLLALTGATGVLIHLDADIAEKITGMKKSFTESGLSRKEYCRQAIAIWLGATEAQALCFVIATHCTETWFLALHDVTTDPSFFTTKILDYESVPDVIKALEILGYKTFIDKETGHTTIDKVALTVDHGTRFAKKIDIVESRCAEIQHLKRYLVSNCTTS